MSRKKSMLNLGILKAVGAGAVAIAAAAVPDLIENHAISMGTVCAVGCIVMPAAWWLSAKFTTINDKFQELQYKLDNLPCATHDCRKTNKEKHE